MLFTTLLLFVLGCLGSTFVDRFSFQYAVFKVRFAGSDPASGDKGIRTPDPLLARQVLSQLSYIPKKEPAATYSPMPSPA